jgi:hypothetical protein
MFRLKYKVQSQNGNFTPLEVKAEGVGGCDVLLLCSLLFPEKGLPSANFFGVDGRKEDPQVQPQEMFFAWLMLGNLLASKEGLSPQQRMLCAHAGTVTGSLAKAEPPGFQPLTKGDENG